MLYLGTILYVTLLLINAMAVLSEDRFLARSTSSGHQPTVNSLTVSTSLSQLAGRLLRHNPLILALANRMPSHTIKPHTLELRMSA